MASFFRRAGAEVLRVLMSPLDPAAEAERALIYGKIASGNSALLTRQDNSEIYTLAPPNRANIWDLPEAPNALDDEFLLTALDPAWSVQSGTFVAGAIDPYAAFAVGDTIYSLSRRRSWLMMQPPADGAAHRLVKTVALGANAFVWMRGSFNCRLNTAPTNNDFNIAVSLSTNPYDTANAVSLAINESDANVIQAEFTEVEGGAGTTVATTIDKFGTQADAQEIEAVGLQKIGTTYHAWAFGCNGMGIYMGSTVFAPAIGTLGLTVVNAVTTAPGNMIMGVDFVRVVNSAVFLP